MADSTPILYRGLKFPFQKGSDSFPREATDEELIQDSLLQLILTLNGERIMRPDVGSNVLRFVFENNDVVLGNLIRSEVQGVIAKYEPRVQLQEVRVEQQDTSVILTIVYIVLATRRTGNVTVAIPVP